MYTAREMRTLAVEVMKAEKAEQEQALTKWLEEEVMPRVKERALHGVVCLDNVELPYKTLDAEDYVTEKLQENGFFVFSKGWTIDIRW